MVVIGIGISMVTLALGDGGRSERFRNDTEQIGGLMQLAGEEAVLTSKPIGLRFVEEFGERTTEYYYEWSVYENNSWQALSEHSIFYPRKFSEGVSLNLILEGRKTALGPNTTKNKQSFGSLKTAEDKYTPDLFFLHSGEIMPPFELELSADQVEVQYRIEGNPLGQLRMKQRSANGEWL